MNRVDLYIDTIQLAAIHRHAAGDPGHEVCGVLIGKRGMVVEVLEILPGDNVTRAPDRYVLDARALLAADDRAAAIGGAIVGFYHSHPGQAPLPSCRDRQTAWPGYIYLIVTAGYGRAGAMCAWSVDMSRRIGPVFLNIAGM